MPWRRAGCLLAAVMALASARALAEPAAVQPPDDCARFVNALLGRLLGRTVRGNAWDVQLLRSNRRALTLVWRVPEADFHRDQQLALRRSGDRALHFRALYGVLDGEPGAAPEEPGGAPAKKRLRGLIGFVFRFSPWRRHVASRPTVLPQTHIALLAGRRRFSLENRSRTSRSIEQIIAALWGPVASVERELAERVLRAPLTQVLGPGGRIRYSDYTLKQRFVRDRECSLLEMLLRKLPAPNRQLGAFRPVSFSRLNLRSGRR